MHVLYNPVHHLLCMCLQAVLIPVILEISSMSLNSEASRVLFLNQTFLQIENYIKNARRLVLKKTVFLRGRVR